MDRKVGQKSAQNLSKIEFFQGLIFCHETWKHISDLIFSNFQKMQ